MWMLVLRLVPREMCQGCSPFLSEASREIAGRRQKQNTHPWHISRATSMPVLTTAAFQPVRMGIGNQVFVEVTSCQDAVAR